MNFEATANDAALLPRFSRTGFGGVLSTCTRTFEGPGGFGAVFGHSSTVTTAPAATIPETVIQARRLRHRYDVSRPFTVERSLRAQAPQRRPPTTWAWGPGG